MDSKFQIYLATLSTSKSSNQFAVIVHNNETGESKIEFFSDAETAKKVYYFVMNAVRISHELI
jgi:hypothetical protein